VLRHFGGAREFNPIVVFFRPPRVATVFRFWAAFKDWKGGYREPGEKVRQGCSTPSNIGGEAAIAPQTKNDTSAGGARNLRDTADIVREGDFSPITGFRYEGSLVFAAVSQVAIKAAGTPG
jgi:hypothetical protein